ncbi:MAG: hypothetical protein L7T84_05120 [Akkermansiaceae bacterium]|nr:hypothetical protein [Akkermansiaceae bacterium]
MIALFYGKASEISDLECLKPLHMMKCLIPLLILGSAIASAADRPNILWLTCENNNVNWIGDGTAPYMKAMKACELSHQNYVSRMQAYLGAGESKARKTKKDKVK